MLNRAQMNGHSHRPVHSAVDQRQHK